MIKMIGIASAMGDSSGIMAEDPLCTGVLPGSPGHHSADLTVRWTFQW